MASSVSRRTRPFRWDFGFEHARERNFYLRAHSEDRRANAAQLFHASFAIASRVHPSRPLRRERRCRSRPAPFAKRSADERAQARVILGHHVTCETHRFVPNKTPRQSRFCATRPICSCRITITCEAIARPIIHRFRSSNG